MPVEPAEQSILDAVAAGFPAAVGALGRLVRIPSVAFPGFPEEPLLASAEAVARLLRDTGAFELVDVRRAEYGAEEGTATGSPAVVARRAAAPGRPTVLLYAHHDVQPAGKDVLWDTPPFEPTLQGERLHGRGASDDKAGVVTHVAAITAALTALDDDLGVGIAVFIEGEEEAGSRSFDAFLAANQDLLAADVIVVADSDNVSTTVPALTSSLRGNVTATVEIATLDHASHSGMFGGAAPDAVLAAIRTLDSLWDADGAVAVPGLLAVQPPDDGPTGPTAAQLVADAALLPGVRPIGRGTVADRLWFGPSITVTGIDVTDVVNASNTLLPSVRVRISCRVAPGQDAGEAFTALEQHLRAHAAFGARITIGDVDLGQPFLVDQSGWAAQEARAALEDGWGAAPELTGIGGSIPFISTLTERFPSAQILITGVEDPDTRAHSPNESQHLGVLRKAITAEALLLARLSRRALD
jgi:cysteinylglycine-S-conjugate dipeptidase